VASPPSLIGDRLALLAAECPVVNVTGVIDMNLYNRFILPRVVHFTCSRNPNMRQRAKVVPSATGEVLEIGFGSGLNLPFYDGALVKRLWALDPAEEMWALAREEVQLTRFPVDFLKAPAEMVPLADQSVDTVVITYTLCTVPDVPRSLAQVARVLRPNGYLLFCEHGLAPDERVRKWQRRLNPVWKKLGGGCHLDRDIPALLTAGGFRTLELETMYIPGWKPASFNSWGRAVPCRTP
jgi:SAM-dependent methyltransferase